MSEPRTEARNLRSEDTPKLSRNLADNHDTDQHSTVHRRAHRQRLRDKIRAERYSRLPRESDELIRFALSWIEYGEPPSDEIMVNFGMTTPRFFEALRQTIHLPDCDPSIVRRIHTAYFARPSTP